MRRVSLLLTVFAVALTLASGHRRAQSEDLYCGAGGQLIAVGDDIEQLFDPSQELLEVTCEYCKSLYHIARDDLRGPLPRLN